MLDVRQNLNELHQPLGKNCDFALISVTLLPSHLGLESPERPGRRDARVGLRERCEPYRERDEYTYQCSCLPGCAVPPCTQVSCKLSRWFYLLIFHVQYCWACRCSARRVITCEDYAGEEGDIKLKENPSLPHNPASFVHHNLDCGSEAPGYGMSH